MPKGRPSPAKQPNRVKYTGNINLIREETKYHLISEPFILNVVTVLTVQDKTVLILKVLYIKFKTLLEGKFFRNNCIQI